MDPSRFCSETEAKILARSDWTIPELMGLGYEPLYPLDVTGQLQHTVLKAISTVLNKADGGKMLAKFYHKVLKSSGFPTNDQIKLFLLLRDKDNFEQYQRYYTFKRLFMRRDFQIEADNI